MSKDSNSQREDIRRTRELMDRIDVDNCYRILCNMRTVLEGVIELQGEIESHRAQIAMLDNAIKSLSRASQDYRKSALTYRPQTLDAVIKRWNTEHPDEELPETYIS